jgi:abequosyltransferase
MNLKNPLLTIAIPTYNRAKFLENLLSHLVSQQTSDSQALIEVIISDNASEDDTQEVISRHVARLPNCSVVKNHVNKGSDFNIAQCFKKAKGQYVLIFGDDDILIDGALPGLIKCLKENEFGLVHLPARSSAEMATSPKRKKKNFEFRSLNDSSQFIAKIGHKISFISGCVINKHLISNVDPYSFCGDSLVQVHLALRAILKADMNAFFTSDMVVATRNNSKGYNFSEVFVTNFLTILSKAEAHGLNAAAIIQVKNRALLSFYPLHILRALWRNEENMSLSYKIFDRGFKRNTLYLVLIKPMFNLPRPLAVFYSACVMCIGRLLYGDAKHGIRFLQQSLGKKQNHYKV